MLSDRRLHSRNRGLGRPDPLGEFSLRKTGFGASLENLIQQLKLFLELFVLPTHFGARQRAFLEILKRVTHLSPLSFALAQSLAPFAGSSLISLYIDAALQIG